MSGWACGGAHVIVAIHVDRGDFAQEAGLDKAVPRLDQVRRAAALRSRLHYSPVPPRGSDHRLAL